MVRYTFASLLSVPLRRQWGILPADAQKKETHPIASIRQDSGYRKRNFCIKIISSFLPNALEIKSQRNDHLCVEDPLDVPHPQMWCRAKPRSASALEVWERSGQSCGPWGSDSPRPGAITVWSWGRSPRHYSPAMAVTLYNYRWKQLPKYMFFPIFPLELYLFSITKWFLFLILEFKVSNKFRILDSKMYHSYSPGDA